MADGFDVIVVGAGSAGCVIAARLSEDPSCRVLLLEAGRSDRSVFCRTPGMLSIIHTVPQVKAKFDWGFYTEPNERTLNRKIPYARGKVVGGSSAINGMVFVRGHRTNYDDWAAEGCTGWGYDDVLPHFRRMETWEHGEDAWRGGSGPIQVTRQADVTPAAAAFREAISQTCGVPVIDDYNGETQEGAAAMQMSLKDGLRSSTSEAYIHPNLHRKNLELWRGAHVLEVLFEGSRAIGLKLRDAKGVREVRADSEIVLAGGAVGSPQLLMLSGIGPADHLNEIGVEPRVDLPVGENLHDHLFFPLVYLAPRGGHVGTARHFFGGMLKELTLGGTWFGKTVFESVAFVKSDPSLKAPDIQFHVLPWAYPAPNQDAPGRPKVDLRPCLTVQPTLIYPKSRGSIRLRSADADDAPIIDPSYLTEPDDIESLVRGIGLTRELMAHDTIASELTGEIEPGAEFFDDAALRKELPNRVCTVYHPVGTCRMGTDERAVVGPDLRVRGVEGLRVADASIMPSITGGNTNAPAIMIGEKASDLIRAG